jgi:pSer/pThr/pTyr-binding forkhead associated (FHA) protein
MPRLDVYCNSSLLLQVKLKEEPVWIGRGTTCDISLNDAGVSRRHAEIRPTAGGWEIENVGRNGTRLNAEVLSKPVPLNFGDRIYIANHALVFQSDDAPAISRNDNIMAHTQSWPALRGEEDAQDR